MVSAWVHATAVLVGSCGVLIRGPAGAGKSTLAIALIERGARLVGDDRVQLSACHGRIVAAGAALLSGRIELRGRGIVAAACERSAIIRLVVDLARDSEVERFPEPAALMTSILGVTLPRQPAPARAEGALPLLMAALRDLSPHCNTTLRMTAV